MIAGNSDLARSYGLPCVSELGFSEHGLAFGRGDEHRVALTDIEEAQGQHAYWSALTHRGQQ